MNKFRFQAHNRSLFNSCSLECFTVRACLTSRKYQLSMKIFCKICFRDNKSLKFSFSEQLMFNPKLTQGCYPRRAVHLGQVLFVNFSLYSFAKRIVNMGLSSWKTSRKTSRSRAIPPRYSSRTVFLFQRKKFTLDLTPVLEFSGDLQSTVQVTFSSSAWLLERAVTKKLFAYAN